MVKLSIKPQSTKLIAVYVRAKDVESAARQLFMAIRYADKHNLKLSHEACYVDISDSDQFPRPAFDRLLREKNKGFEEIYVTGPDRLSRDFYLACYATELIQKAGLTLKVMR